MKKYIAVFLAVILAVPLFSQELTPKKVKKLWGFVDDKDSMVIEPKYSAVGKFHGRYAWVNIGGKGKAENPLGGLWGVIDRSGKEVCPVKYDYVDFCGDGLVAVNVGGYMGKKKVLFFGGKWGYVDLATGKECVPVIYDQVGPFNNGDIAWAYKGDGQYKKLATVVEKNPKGKNVYYRRFDLPSDIKRVNCFSTNSSGSGAWGLINKEGRVFTKFIYTSAGEFQNGYAWVYNNGFGLVDSVGHLTVPCKFKDITNCYKEKVVWVWVRKDKDKKEVSLCSAITGEVISERKYDAVWNFNDNVAWCKSNEKFALIDAQGHELIKPTYTDTWPFWRKIACVKSGKKYGYVNNKGQVVAEPKYDNVAAYFGEASPFKYQGERILSWVKRGDELDWIDQTGKVVKSKSQRTFSIFETIPNELWDY